MEEIKIAESDRCVVCLQPGKFLCNKHRRVFMYYRKHDFVAAKRRIRISKPQRALFVHLRKILKVPCFNEVLFSFSFPLRYDIVVCLPGRFVIFEYDGRQHDLYVPFFHKNKANFEAMKERDIEKDNIANEHGIDVIRFSCIEKIEEDYIRKKLRLRGVNV